MALYPQTTCFYKAVVSHPPALACDDYEVLFEDPTYVDGFSPPLRIAQRYVLPFKDPTKKKWSPASSPCPSPDSWISLGLKF